ncbi:MAG: cbb3-type cytochrome c oxidase subunit 3 [Pseudomonadota bacterium]
MELISILQSIWTVLAMLIFIGVTMWAYSRSRQTSLEALGKSVLDDDDSVVSLRQGGSHVYK